MSAPPRTQRRPLRRLAAVLATVGLLGTAGCAAGQVAQTANQKPTLDGTEVDVGKLALRGLAIKAPSSTFYAVGANAQVRVVIVNTGSSNDRLTGVTSPAITGWAAYATELGAQGDVGGAQSVTVAGGNRASFGTPDTRAVLLLKGMKVKGYPGNTVPITFTFANAGSVTWPVPIQISATPASSTVPATGASEG